MPYPYGITLARSPESGHHCADSDRNDNDSDRNDNELRQTAADFTQPPGRATVRELSTTEGPILIFRVGPATMCMSHNQVIAISVSATSRDD